MLLGALLAPGNTSSCGRAALACPSACAELFGFYHPWKKHFLASLLWFPVPALHLVPPPQTRGCPHRYPRSSSPITGASTAIATPLRHAPAVPSPRWGGFQGTDGFCPALAMQQVLLLPQPILGARCLRLLKKYPSNLSAARGVLLSFTHCILGTETPDPATRSSPQLWSVPSLPSPASARAACAPCGWEESSPPQFSSCFLTEQPAEIQKQSAVSE